jgi:hypothetical protein
MRIATSSPIRWAIGFAIVATIALFATRSPAPRESRAKPSAHTRLSKIERQLDRIELAAIERDLDAMIDQLQVAADAVDAASSSRERAIAREALARLELEIHDRAQREQDRSDELRSRLDD